jgi:hypothetical protein
MTKIILLRVEMNDGEEERFKEELEQFKNGVRVALYRGAMTVDVFDVKEK